MPGRDTGIRSQGRAQMSDRQCGMPTGEARRAACRPASLRGAIHIGLLCLAGAMLATESAIAVQVKDVWGRPLGDFDLRPGVDLHGVNLRYANLQEIDLTGADLSHADLRYADLTGAILRESLFHKVLLRGAKLDDADFSDARMDWATLSHASLKGTMLRSATMDYADLRYADLEEADLSGAFLFYVKMDHANLQRAALRKADVRYAELRHADLRDTNLAGVLRIEDVKFDRTRFNETTLFPPGFDPAREPGLTMGDPVALPTIAAGAIAAVIVLMFVLARVRRVI